MSASDIRLAHLRIVEVGKFVSFVIQFIPHVDKELAICYCCFTFPEVLHPSNGCLKN